MAIHYSIGMAYVSFVREASFPEIADVPFFIYVLYALHRRFVLRVVLCDRYVSFHVRS
jgi:hypothetical protein